MVRKNSWRWEYYLKNTLQRLGEKKECLKEPNQTTMEKFNGDSCYVWVCKSNEMGRAINKVPLAFNSFLLANFSSTVVRGYGVSTPSIDLISGAGGNLMSKNTQEALAIIENKAKVQTFRNKPQVSSNGDTSTQIDAIAVLTKQVEALGYHIASMQETYDQIPSLSTPKPKEIPKLNPHQPLISYPSRLQKDKFQALENPTGLADHFIYRIDIVDSLCDKSPIENNSLSGNPAPSFDLNVAPLSPFPTPFEDSNSLLEETDTLLSHSDDSLPDYETFSFDIEEKSSGSTTSHFDHSFSDYEAFCFDVDHIEESDSHHEEFADELAHIISPPDDLLLTDPSKIKTFLSFPSRNEVKVFDLGILLIDRFLSFTIKSPHLPSDNFEIDKSHILSEITLKIISSVSFLPMDKEIQGESS
nr:hypothetical protein [Tanacetum cinerariifolium]